MNNPALIEYIENKGIKFNKIAEYLGISRMALRNKLSGKSEFSQTEIATLKSELSMTERDFLVIFFDDYVAENSTNE